MLVEVVQSGFAPRETVALALAVCSITYGAGQLLSGYLGDRFKPQNIILIGFLITSAVNLLVGCMPDARFLTPLWAVNGVAQAFMWPPLVAILAAHLEKNAFNMATKWTGWGSAFGTIAVYALSPLVIELLDFRYVFIFAGGLALMMAFVWKVLYEQYFSHASGRRKEAAQQPAGQKLGRRGVFFLGVIMLSITLQGALRDGVSTWTPTLVSETFHLSSSSAILSGVLLPVFHILCTQLASKLHSRLHGNELLVSGLMYGAIAALALVLASGSSLIVSVVCLALMTGCVHGVNFELTCMVPAKFRRFGHIGLISGVLNSSTYVGSALSTYGIALLSESSGWDATILLWADISLAGLVISACICRSWARFIREE